MTLFGPSWWARIMKANTAPVGLPWLWTYGFNPLERQPAHGYSPTREAAMTPRAKRSQREAEAPAAHVCLPFPDRLHSGTVATGSA
jgi:hypothetical protein